MTTEQKIIFAIVIGSIALLIGLAVLIYKIVRKVFYDYNEYTGRVELKSKIKRESEIAKKEYEERQKKIKLEKRLKPYSVQPMDWRAFHINSVAGDDIYSVKVVDMGSDKGRYAIKFRDIIYEEDVISLYVDEATYKRTKIGEAGNLACNYKYKIFYYFEPFFNVVPDDI
jgi:uncharacterized protein YeeX (DUF496 family)